MKRINIDLHQEDYEKLIKIANTANRTIKNMIETILKQQIHIKFYQINEQQQELFNNIK